ncbi:hypothetical protein H4582DRAFT_69890 [Lactarius indigo]|nr:hypothetical protein H4582DRAFT_69890 [Lactarius indigo]
MVTCSLLRLRSLFKLVDLLDIAAEDNPLTLHTLQGLSIWRSRYIRSPRPRSRWAPTSDFVHSSPTMWRACTGPSHCRCRECNVIHVLRNALDICQRDVAPLPATRGVKLHIYNASHFFRYRTSFWGGFLGPGATSNAKGDTISCIHDHRVDGWILHTYTQTHPVSGFSYTNRRANAYDSYIAYPVMFTRKDFATCITNTLWTPSLERDSFQSCHLSCGLEFSRVW